MNREPLQETRQTTRGTAQIQGALWGARVQDYADIVEGMMRPLFEAVVDGVGIASGDRLLDIGCGPGLAAAIAARRGASVSGLDAAESSIAIARQRTPSGDFRTGEMEDLPWPDAAFDVVTGFNVFQYAADPVNALREARRVTRPGGYVAVGIWGREEDCEGMVTGAAVRKLLPPAPAANGGPPIFQPGRLEALMEQAGLQLVTSGEVDCPFDFPDLATAVRGHLSAGLQVAAIQQVGFEPVRQAVIESLAPFRTQDGRYLQRNKFRYVIASQPNP